MNDENVFNQALTSPKKDNLNLSDIKELKLSPEHRMSTMVHKTEKPSGEKYPNNTTLDMQDTTAEQNPLDHQDVILKMNPISLPEFSDAHKEMHKVETPKFQNKQIKLDKNNP